MKGSGINPSTKRIMIEVIILDSTIGWSIETPVAKIKQIAEARNEAKSGARLATEMLLERIGVRPDKGEWYASYEIEMGGKWLSVGLIKAESIYETAIVRFDIQPFGVETSAVATAKFNALPRGVSEQQFVETLYAKLKEKSETGYNAGDLSEMIQSAYPGFNFVALKGAYPTVTVSETGEFVSLGKEKIPALELSAVKIEHWLTELLGIPKNKRYFIMEDVATEKGTAIKFADQLNDGRSFLVDSKNRIQLIKMGRKINGFLETASGARLASSAEPSPLADRLRVVETSETPNVSVLTGSRLAVQNFLIGTAHAQPLSQGQAKDITVLLSREMLVKIGLKLEGTQLITTAPALFPDFEAIDLSQTQVKGDTLEAKVSVADLMTILKQKQLARTTALDGLLDDLDKKIKVVNVVDRALLGDLNGPKLALLAAEAYKLSQRDPNFRIKLNLDVADAALVQVRLIQLEAQMKLTQGTLTRLFKQDGFEKAVELYLQAPDSASRQGEGIRNLVLNSENLLGFDLDFAVVTARLDKKNLLDARYQSAYSIDADPSLQIESEKLLSVIMGQADKALRYLYARLPQVSPVDMKTLFSLAEMVIRSVGKSA